MTHSTKEKHGQQILVRADSVPVRFGRSLHYFLVRTTLV